MKKLLFAGYTLPLTQNNILELKKLLKSFVVFPSANNINSVQELSIQEEQ